MDLSFLSPMSALVGLAVVIPLAAIAARERRHRAVREALRLEHPPARARWPEIAVWLVAFGLLAAAAAQPVVRVPGTVERRADAEAFVVIDTTRSMLAARSAESPMRIQRAKELAVELRRALADVPFGVASHTNRSLPHLFPTPDAAQFELVVDRAVGVNRPPGTEKTAFAVSTNLSALEALANDNFFSSTTTKRLAIVLSDGESQLYSVRRLVVELNKGGVAPLLVQLWHPDERVWQRDGSPEPLYLPSEISTETYAALAELTIGGRVYGEDEVDAAVSAARAYLRTGPLVEVAAPGRTSSLAPYAVLAACIPLAFLVLPGILPWFRRRGKLAYSMLPAWRASSTPVRPRSRGTQAPSPQTSSGTRSPMGASSPGID